MTGGDRAITGPASRLYFSAAWARIAAAVWIAIVVTCCLSAFLKPHSHTVFPIYSHAGESWIAGRDLYVIIPNYDFYRYSPSFAAMVAPWTDIGDAWGGMLWRAIGAGLLAWSLIVWSKSVWRRSDAGEIGLLFLLVAPLFLQNAHNGQANVHLLAMLLFGSADAAKGRVWRSAIWFAAAALIKPYALAIAAMAALTQPRLGLRLVAALAIGVGIPFLLQDPHYVAAQYKEWFHHFSGNDRSLAELRDQYRDLALLLRVYIRPVPRIVFTVGTALAGLALAAFVRRRHIDRATAFHLGCCWITALGPATESCTYLLLAPSLAASVLDRPGQSGRWVRVAYALLAATVCASMFPSDWRIQVLGPQPIAAMIFLVELIRSSLGTHGASAVRLRAAAA